MKKYLIITVLLILVCCGFYIYKLTTYTYISAKFAELRPIHQKLPVYYKGIKIGKAREHIHSKDFNHTLINIVLYPKNLMIPSNSEVLLKKEKNKDKYCDFLELIYPKNPSKLMIANGAVLEGKATVDIETYMASQKIEDLETIKENLFKSSQELAKTVEEVEQMFEIINSTLSSVSPNIENTTKNVSDMTKKVNDSIDEQSLENAVSNIEASTKNINDLTLSLNNVSDGVNDIIPKTGETVDEINGITSNVNAITCGVRKTLRKRFGGLRLIFGQVIDECN